MGVTCNRALMLFEIKPIALDCPVWMKMNSRGRGLPLKLFHIPKITNIYRTRVL